jgi:hypothetical protein
MAPITVNNRRKIPSRSPPGKSSLEKLPSEMLVMIAEQAPIISAALFTLTSKTVYVKLGGVF